MINVVISIGANCGNRREAVGEAIRNLREILQEFRCSEIYETPCAGREGRPYVNAVVSGMFNAGKEQLEKILKAYETDYGRDAACRERGDVPIDIDIVMVNGEILKAWDFRQKFFQIGFRQLN